MTNFDRNITRLYLIKISKWFNMVMPIYMAFYVDNGLSMYEAFQLKAIYSVAIVAMEIPSGWMADVWGRKRTLILGSILGSAGFFIYSFSYGFRAFATAEVILGIGYSFISGADSAMLYDSLKASNKSDQYIKIEGRITSIGNFSEAIAGIASGLLVAISLRTPFYFQFFVAAMAIPASFMLVEPKFHTVVQKLSITLLIRNIKNTFLSNKDLRIAIILSSITGASTLTFAWLVQPFLIALNIPDVYFGILWTALNLTVGVSSLFAFKVEKYFNRTQSVLFIIMMLTIGYLLSGFSIVIWGIGFLFLFYLVRGFSTIVLKNYINLYVESDVRATMLSVRNFIIRMSFAVIGPLLGWITDNISLKCAFILAGAIYFIASVIVVIPWLRKNI